MSGERTVDGWELRLRSRGADRYVSGAFLAFWLCGWAVGESFVLWLLVKGAWALLTGTPPEPGRALLETGPAVLVGLFLLVWLTLWTIGGIAAAMELLRLLWGEDRIRVTSGRLTVSWIRGPFRSTRHFERDAIRQIALVGRRGHLSLQTTNRTTELSGLGTRAEREAAAATLRSELALSNAATARGLPGEWVEIITPEGERALVGNPATRRKQARFTSMLTLFLVAVTFVVAREVVHRRDLMVPTLILLAFTIAFDDRNAVAGARPVGMADRQRAAHAAQTLRIQCAGGVRSTSPAARNDDRQRRRPVVRAGRARGCRPGAEAGSHRLAHGGASHPSPDRAGDG